MNRQILFDEIESRLSWLATRIELRSSLNILNLNLHSEDFYKHLLNAVYGLALVNLNDVEQNVAGLDLIDDQKKLVVQVSSTATKQKIESTLAKNFAKYKGFTFRFVSISKKVSGLSKLKILNPSGLLYDPDQDTLDISKILSHIKGQNIETIKKIRDLVFNELKPVVDRDKVETNLATIIDILAQVDWKLAVGFSTQIIPYDIENKILFNKLSSARVLIDDYKSYYFKIDQIYSTFDEQGTNRSLSVLNGLRNLYVQNMKDPDSDAVFSSIVSEAMERITESANYTPIPTEELQMGVEILTVDAFIRCKIFENPEGYLNAASR